MVDMALSAAVDLAQPSRLMFLALGVLIGLVVGVIPGLGGLIGLSLLLPFTYGMEPMAGLAMLIGLAAVTTTSDTIPAVLFGVPGTVGSAATTLDGHPMAQKGQANRAFGAAFMASMIGGLIGALLLAVTIPFLRPVMLAIGTPDLLAFCIFGLSLVAVLSGRDTFKGVAGACLGLLLAMVGEDAQAGEMRWTFDTIYLWDGLQIVPLALGLFALPELADLAIKRSTIVAPEHREKTSSQFEGVIDVFRNKFLVARCAGIGALLGAIPGLGAAVIDWIAYAHAAKTVKGAQDTFGKGDVRGVIASESSNNAKEGGSLVPTIAFGVPGSASMALILGVFTVHGIVPGPRMLAENLNITYGLVWSVALANVLGAGICFFFAHKLAKLALLRASILVPLVLAVSFIGAFQGQKAWGDLYLLLAAGVLGFVMKRLGWSRPPVILGFVLGALLENYTFISTLRYGTDWLARPVVIVMLSMAAFGIFGPVVRRLIARRHEPRRAGTPIKAHLDWRALAFPLLMLALFVYALVTASAWSFGSKLFPIAAALIGGAAVSLVLIQNIFLSDRQTTATAHGVQDIAVDFGDLTNSVVLRRAIVFFGWCLFYLGAAAVVGMLPAMAIFLFLFLRFGGNERTATAAMVAVGMTAFSYLLFHWILVVPWPDALVGDMFPHLRSFRATRLF
jgi:TctA family transporter